jgi:hypothetical protein
VYATFRYKQRGSKSPVRHTHGAAYYALSTKEVDVDHKVNGM